MEGFSRRENNTQIVSFVLFIFLQQGLKIQGRIHKPCGHPPPTPLSMILECPHVKNAALILSGGKSAFIKSALLGGIRQKSHLTDEQHESGLSENSQKG